MTAALSQDLRRRIVRSVEMGSSIRQAAARNEISPSAAVKLLRRLRQTGSLKPERIGGHRRPILEPHQDLLRVAGVEAAIRAVGATLLYLPPYSPDLNPIEQVFAKPKALLRKAAVRTKDALWSTIRQVLEVF